MLNNAHGLSRFSSASFARRLARRARRRLADAQPIKLVVPWAPGGFTDVFGRIIADKLTKSLGQPVIVENKPGASGGIGSEFVARAAPDGYTLLLHTSDTLVWNVGMADAYRRDPAANQKPPYDPLRDFTHVTLMGTQPVLFLVGSHVPANTLAEFVTMAKAKPGTVTYGSSGEGSAVHLAMESFSSQAGIKMIHVPYKGINPALMDVLAGQVQALFLSVQGAGGNIQTGKLQAARHHVADALGARAQRADDRRIGLSRFPAHVVVRDRRAEGLAAGHRRQAQSRGQGGARPSPTSRRSS